MGRPSSIKRFFLDEEPITEDIPIDTSNFVTREELASTLDDMFKKYLQPQTTTQPKQRHRNQNKGGLTNETTAE